MRIKTKALISYFDSNSENRHHIKEQIQYSNPDEFCDKLEVILRENGTSLYSNDFIEVSDLNNGRLIFGNLKLGENPTYFYSDDEIALNKIHEKYVYIGEALEEINKLIENNYNILEIQNSYKAFKEWVASEYKEFGLHKYNGTQYKKRYFLFISKLNNQDLKSARVCGTKPEIESAIYQAKIDYDNSSSKFFEYFLTSSD